MGSNKWLKIVWNHKNNTENTMNKFTHLTIAAFMLMPLVLPKALAESWTMEDYPLTEAVSESRVRFGTSGDGQALTMVDKTYTKGIGFLGWGEIPIYLDGLATRFTAIVGNSDRDVKRKPCVEFVAVGDDKVLWSSGPMECGLIKEVDVPLQGIRKLTLKVLAVPNRDRVCANWVNPVIEYHGGIPTACPTQIVIGAKGLKLEFGVRKNKELVLDGLSDATLGVRSPIRGALFPASPWRQGHTKLLSPIEIVDADGWNGLDLRYVSHVMDQSQPGTEHLTITLEDKQQRIAVELHLRAFQKNHVIEEWLTLTNQGTKMIQVPRLQPGFLPFSPSRNPSDVFLETCVTEGTNPGVEKLSSGIKIIESRDFERHCDNPLPWFTLGIGSPSQENKGSCLIGSLAWSGATRMSFESTAGLLMVGIGVGNPGIPTVAPDETTTSPIFAFAYSGNGKGNASRSFHRYARQIGIAGGDRIRPVDNNSWEGCTMNVNEKAIIDMMQQSHDLGIELYVLDDGWFGIGENARVADKTGLGDWTIDPNKFPNGFAPVIEAANKMPISFGLWFEPEMMNPKSDFMQKHPDWVMRHPAQDLRQLNLRRNQVAIDVPNPAVQDFMYHTVEDVLQANPGIRMIKWDCNSSLNNAYSPYLASKGISQGNLLNRYMEGYYSVLRKLQQGHPDIDFQACAAGGGRADMGAMRYSHTYWPSDNTNPFYRLHSVWNYQTVLPAIATTCHVTHAGQFQPKFRFDVAMMGQLGMEVDTRKSTPEYLSAAKTGIAAYKNVRETVQFGDQYRTSEHPSQTATPSLNYVSADRSNALVLAFQIRNLDKAPLLFKAPVQGLDEDRKYRVEEINLPDGDAQPRLIPSEKQTVRTGKEWMKDGIPLSFTRQMDSAAIRLIAE